MLNGLDLFSGIGGLTLALGDWVRPVAYCEQDRFCQAVLLSAMQRGDLPYAPIWTDVRTLRREHLDVPIDIVYGGFPCQDISAAGNGRGLVGERSGLYWEVERLVKETNPRFVFLENVPAIRTRGLNAVVQSLTELGYDCRWTIVSAEEVGSPHIRKRWFLLAHARGQCELRTQQSIGEKCKNPPVIKYDGAQKPLAHAADDGLRRRLQFTQSESIARARDWWEVEPSVGRVADGVPNRMDCLRGLGNSVVPAQAREAFMRLMGLTDFLRESGE